MIHGRIFFYFYDTTVLVELESEEPRKLLYREVRTSLSLLFLFIGRLDHLRSFILWLHGAVGPRQLSFSDHLLAISVLVIPFIHGSGPVGVAAHSWHPAPSLGSTSRDFLRPGLFGDVFSEGGGSG